MITLSTAEKLKKVRQKVKDGIGVTTACDAVSLSSGQLYRYKDLSDAYIETVITKQKAKKKDTGSTKPKPKRKYAKAETQPKTIVATPVKDTGKVMAVVGSIDDIKELMGDML